jgi:hypothetical protein
MFTLFISPQGLAYANDRSIPNILAELSSINKVNLVQVPEIAIITLDYYYYYCYYYIIIIYMLLLK